MTSPRNLLIALLLATGLFALPATPGHSAEPQSLSVIELFTSQGCSSCPPADALMRQYKNRDDVLALSLNVDYWDYLGWKDTLASPANSQRQRAYAITRRDRAVYTPQVVANGLMHAPGYDASAIETAIARTQRRLGKERVKISFRTKGKELKAQILDQDPAATINSGTVWLVLYSKQETVSIQRGENTGRKITYHNVVREMTPVGSWSGKATNFTLPKNDVMSRGYDGCAIVLQAGTAGPILGAAVLKDL